MKIRPLKQNTKYLLEVISAVQDKLLVVTALLVLGPTCHPDKQPLNKKNQSVGLSMAKYSPSVG